MRLILPLGYAGAETESRTAIRLTGLRQYGWQCTVYSPGIATVDEALQRADVDVRHLPMRGLTDFATIRRLALHLVDEASDTVMLAQSYRTAFISLCARKLAGRKDLRVALLYRRREMPQTTWLARRVYRNLSEIIFTSEYSQTEFHRAGEKHGAPLAPVQRQHLWLEGVGEAPAQCEEPKGPVIVLYNGELRHGCGLGRLIEKLPALRGRRIRLLVAGQGRPEYMDRLRRRSIRSGAMDMVSWRRDRIALPDIAAQCHFGVYPYKDESGFADANIEMMAAGRPQIVAAGSVAEEYLGQDGGGLFVASDNVDGFLQTMDSMARAMEQRQQLGNMAHRRYNNLFAPEKNLRELATLLGSVSR